MDEIKTEGENGMVYRCKRCAQEKALVLCTVCNQSKEKRNFTQVHSTTSIHRCNDCRTCDVCGVFFADAKHLVCNVARCTACVPRKCTLCVTVKAAKEFDGKQIKNVILGQQHKLLCISCSQVKMYSCAAHPCRNQQKPEWEFDAVLYLLLLTTNNNNNKNI